MIIDKKLVYVKKKEVFEPLIASIPQGLNPLVFIEDTREMWTCGTYFSIGYPSIEVSEVSGSVKVSIGNSFFMVSTTGESLSVRKGDGNRIILSSNALNKIDTEYPLEWNTTDKKLLHSISKVTPGSYGQSTNLSNASIFIVPNINVDQYGHISFAGNRNVEIRDYVEQLAPSSLIGDKSVLLSYNEADNNSNTAQVRQARGMTYNDSTQRLRLEKGLDTFGPVNVTHGDMTVVDGYIVGKLKGDVEGEATPKIHLSEKPEFGGSSTKLYGHVLLKDLLGIVKPDPSSVNATTTNKEVIAYAASPLMVWEAIETAKEYADSILSANNAMLFQSDILAGTSSPGTFTPAAEVGHTYVVNFGNTSYTNNVGYINGEPVEIGDLLICKKETTASNSSNWQEIHNNWTYVQTNTTGTVSGPSSSAVGQVAIFNSTTGRLIKGIVSGAASQLLTMGSDGMPQWKDAPDRLNNALAFTVNEKDVFSFDGSASKTINFISGSNMFISYDVQGNITLAADPGSDTVNTAGATDLINKKLFLIGAESQTTSPQTYSNQYVYIGIDNCLYSSGTKVSIEGHTHTFAELLNKPTTVAGYGIIDAIQFDGRLVAADSYKDMGYGYPTEGWGTTGPAFSFGASTAYRKQIQGSAGANELSIRNCDNNVWSSWRAFAFQDWVNTTLNDYVTLGTNQTITGVKKFTGKIEMNYSAISDNADFVGFYTSIGGGKFIAARGILVSGSYSDSVNIPDQGIYAIGEIKAKSFTKRSGTSSQLLRADGGVAKFTFDLLPGQPGGLWGGDINHDYALWNPANFRVANADTVGDVGINNLFKREGLYATVPDIWGNLQVSQLNGILPDGLTNAYNFGALISIPVSDSKFQMYAAHLDIGLNNESALYFRTGWNADKKQWTKILTDRNWYATTDGRYLPLTGGTMRGAIEMNNIAFALNGNATDVTPDGAPWYGLKAGADNRVYLSGYTGIKLKTAWQEFIIPQNAGNLTHNGYTIWDSGNDGAGSGLDADLLDGLDSASFPRYTGWVNSPGWDANELGNIIKFTYSNNAPSSGAVLSVSANGYGFQLHTSYGYDNLLYYRRFGRSGDGGVGSWQTLARLTDNVASATKLSTNRTNYKGITDDNVVGELMWKHYGQNHTIFDASSSTAPNGSGINNADPQVSWGATYPTLMGWNGNNTYGVRVDYSSRTDKLQSARNIFGHSFDGTGNVDGIVYSNSNGINNIFGSQNSSWCHFQTNASSGFHFNKNISVVGDIYGGSSYNRRLAYMDEINAQVGGSKSAQMLWNTWGTDIYGGAIQIREYGNVTTNQSGWEYAPSLSFHWGGRHAKKFGIRSDGLLAVDDVPISISGHIHDDRYTKTNFSFNTGSGTVTGDFQTWITAMFNGGGYFNYSSITTGNWCWACALAFNSPVGSINPTGAMVIYSGSGHNEDKNYKHFLVLDAYSDLYGITSNEENHKRYSKFVKTTDTIAKATIASQLGSGGNLNAPMTFHWSGQGGQPNWLWGGNDGVNMYVYNPANFSVNYANSAGSVERANLLSGYGTNPDGSHPGYGAKVFYSWNQGQANNPNVGYSNGITIGANPGDTAYGFQIVQNMWDDRTYIRRYNSGWQTWKTVAYTDDINGYLPLSGGTITGDLGVNGGIYSGATKMLSMASTGGTIQLGNGNNPIRIPVGAGFNITNSSGSSPVMNFSGTMCTATRFKQFDSHTANYPRVPVVILEGSIYVESSMNGRAAIWRYNPLNLSILTSGDGAYSTYLAIEDQKGLTFYFPGTDHTSLYSNGVANTIVIANGCSPGNPEHNGYVTYMWGRRNGCRLRLADDATGLTGYINVTILYYGAHNWS